jgi:hypothetical protein
MLYSNFPQANLGKMTIRVIPEPLGPFVLHFRVLYVSLTIEKTGGGGGGPMIFKK